MPLGKFLYWRAWIADAEYLHYDLGGVTDTLNWTEFNIPQAQLSGWALTAAALTKSPGAMSRGFLLCAYPHMALSGHRATSG